MTNARSLRTTSLSSAMAAVVTAVLLPSGAAVAASDVLRDDAGDVTAVAVLSESSKPTPTRSRRSGDVTSVHTRYRGRAVAVTIRMRELPRTVFATVQLTTPAGGRPYGVLASGRRGAVEVGLFRGQDTETLLACDGLAVRLRPRQQALTIRFPAACVGSPRWVRTGAAVSAMSVPAPAELMWPGALDDMTFFIDVAGMSAMTEKYYNSTTTRLPLGPRVRRG